MVAVKCENNEGWEFKKCKVRGRLKIDATGEEGKGYVGRDLWAMVMILEVNLRTMENHWRALWVCERWLFVIEIKIVNIISLERCS